MKRFLNYETISYVIVGILTTLVDYLVFALVNEWLKASIPSFPNPAAAATAAAWLAAVSFAYIANKLVVFKSFAFHPSVIVKEAAAFFTARIISGVITLILMWIFADKMGWNAYLTKILTSVFNLVFNYVASKLFIFKK